MLVKVVGEQVLLGHLETIEKLEQVRLVAEDRLRGDDCSVCCFSDGRPRRVAFVQDLEEGRGGKYEIKVASHNREEKTYRSQCLLQKRKLVLEHFWGQPHDQLAKPDDPERLCASADLRENAGVDDPAFWRACLR